MATPKQIEANRINAQHSTGPKTDDGKAQSRLNAFKHGLRAEGVDVLPGENAETYRARMELWIDDYQPADTAEEQLVRHAADLTWKLDRARRYETAALSLRITQARQDAERQEIDPDEAAALASFDPGIEGERLRRYQFALGREFIRTIGEIKKLQHDRLKCANKANSDAASGDRGQVAGTRRSRDVEAPNEPISSKESAPNEPISEKSVQCVFGSEPVQSASPTQTPAPNEPNRPRPMTQRDRAIAKMLKRAKSRH